MATIHFHETARATPEQFVEALTDFGRHTYTLTRQPDGTTDIDVVIVREGKNVKGRRLGSFLGTVGRRTLLKAFDDTVTAVDARYDRAPVG